ncbi:DUF4136 domain-containing protein [Winogradskyella vincentii]|uniref:DUF4136 domain-containing protein n=1 Tax=Winogradskyella vincentii TaxID=2877122 RepID=A0ABS7Y2T2_9FLAO|nr:DUF4136 domain-containing protein [Winogradskyella vincentii]MCA0153921.1 DUF4136 domain-containing protein [Winogradskyella vincentii]
MKTVNKLLLLLFAIILGCASTSEVVYDYNLEVDFNQYDTYVLCMDDFFVEHTNHPDLDNEEVRRIIGDAVALEIENKGHRTNVLKPQLQAGFRLLISEETAEFTDCEHSEELEYWESCTIHTETYEEETLVVYVADFETKKVIWHASIVCDLQQSEKKLKPYIYDLVSDLYDTYPKTLVAKNPDEKKEFETF